MSELWDQAEADGVPPSRRFEWLAERLRVADTRLADATRGYEERLDDLAADLGRAEARVAELEAREAKWAEAVEEAARLGLERGLALAREELDSAIRGLVS